MKDFLNNMFIKEAKPALNRHAGGGGTSIPETIILVDENGSECSAVLTSEKVNLTATTDDIRKGKTAITENGIETGERFIPKEEVKSITVTENGTVEVLPSEGCTMSKVNVSTQIYDKADPRVGMMIAGTLGEFSDDTITRIGDYAFYGFENLTSVEVPEVTYIGDSAFNGCRALKNISLPKLKTLLHEPNEYGDQLSSSNVFAFCESLVSVDAPLLEVTGWYMFEGCSSLTEVNMPNLKKTNGSTFSRTGIKYANFTNLTEVSNSDFSGCVELTSVNMPLVERLGYNSFDSCASLKSISLPNVTSIESYAFNNCTSLENISAPKLTNIGGSVFYNSAIKELDLPSVTTLTDGFFGWSADTTITSIRMPSLTSIPSYNAFGYGAALKTIEFAQPLMFGSNCFYNCLSLNTIIMRNTTISTLMDTYSFVGTPFNSSGGICLVPSDLITEYQNAMNWSYLYGNGTCRFWALEDYTVDGTKTGDINWDKLNADREGV